MKKLIFILPVFLVFGLIPSVFAAKNETGTQNTGAGQQVQQQTQSPSGNQVKNQNQVQTQNQGEDKQIQTQTQEQESLGDGQGEGMVAQKVQELLQIKTTGGIGDQVRQVAREQNQAQAQIQKQLNKLDSKGQVAKLLFGTDYGAVKNLKAQLEQNQLRIRQLEQLQNQLVNQGDATMVQEATQALIQENTSLQEKIAAEGQTKSLFGWLLRLFVK